MLRIFYALQNHKRLYTIFEGHKKFSRFIKCYSDGYWIVSYDLCDEIKKLYKPMPQIQFSLKYSAYKSRKGQEVIFSSPKLNIEDAQNLL